MGTRTTTHCGLTCCLRYITYYPAPYLPLCNLLGSFPYFSDIYPRTE